MAVHTTLVTLLSRLQFQCDVNELVHQVKVLQLSIILATPVLPSLSSPETSPVLETEKNRANQEVPVRESCGLQYIHCTLDNDCQVQLSPLNWLLVLSKVKYLHASFNLLCVSELNVVHTISTNSIYFASMALRMFCFQLQWF